LLISFSFNFPQSTSALQQEGLRRLFAEKMSLGWSRHHAATDMWQIVKKSRVASYLGEKIFGNPAVSVRPCGLSAPPSQVVKYYRYRNFDIWK